MTIDKLSFVIKMIYTLKHSKIIFTLCANQHHQIQNFWGRWNGLRNRKKRNGKEREFPIKWTNFINSTQRRHSVVVILNIFACISNRNHSDLRYTIAIVISSSGLLTISSKKLFNKFLLGIGFYKFIHKNAYLDSEVVFNIFFQFISFFLI